MDAFNFSVTRKVLDSENIVDEIKEIRDGYVHDTEYSWSIERYELFFVQFKRY